MKGVSPRELDELYRKAVKAGCTVTQTKGSNHVRVVAPGGGQIQGPLTSSDRRGVLNTRTRIRRLGVQL